MAAIRHLGFIKYVACNFWTVEYIYVKFGIQTQHNQNLVGKYFFLFREEIKDGGDPLSWIYSVACNCWTVGDIQVIFSIQTQHSTRI